MTERAQQLSICAQRLERRTADECVRERGIGRATSGRRNGLPGRRAGEWGGGAVQPGRQQVSAALSADPTRSGPLRTLRRGKPAGRALEGGAPEHPLERDGHRLRCRREPAPAAGRAPVSTGPRPTSTSTEQAAVPCKRARFTRTTSSPTGCATSSRLCGAAPASQWFSVASQAASPSIAPPVRPSSRRRARRPMPMLFRRLPSVAQPQAQQNSMAI